MKRKLVIVSSLATVMALGPLAGNAAFASDVDHLHQEVPQPEQLQILPESVTGVSPRSLSSQEEGALTVQVSLSTKGKVTGNVSRPGPSSTPVEAATVNLEATSPGETKVTAEVKTNDSGNFSHQFDLPGGTWTVKASGTVDSVSFSGSATTTIDSKLKLAVSQPKVQSLTRTWLTVKLTDRGQGASGSVTVDGKEPNAKKFKRLGKGNAASNGIFKLPVRPWMKPAYKVTVKRKGQKISATKVGATTPTFKAVKRPSGMPEPAVRFPLGQLPRGSNSNTKVRKIPNSVWRSMQGLSWRRGCVARSRLRLIETNYRGFDGYRHRGQVLVARSIGAKAKRIFTKFYTAKFPLRSMRLVDVFGKNVGGRPGANDYKSMAADNTSAFNCRYVVGRESARVRSPHASGRSIDINTWENPYVVGGSVFPTRSYLNRRVKHPAMFKGGTKALSIMRSQGCRWGGSYADYHHFDC